MHFVALYALWSLQPLTSLLFVNLMQILGGGGTYGDLRATPFSQLPLRAVYELLSSHMSPSLGSPEEERNGVSPYTPRYSVNLKLVPGKGIGICGSHWGPCAVHPLIKEAIQSSGQ